MNAIDDIQAKYMTALSEVTADGGWVEWPAVRLALRLAVQDAYTAGGALADDLAAIVASQAQASPEQRAAESAINQIGRLNEWLEVNAPALYHNPDLDTAAAIVAAIATLKNALEDNREDAASARQELTTLIAERDQLRQQMVQMDADEAAQRRSIIDLQREVDRLTRQNGIAVDTFNSLTHVNSAGPNPTTAPGWNRNHPAWEGLPKADLDVIDQLNGGLTTFRRLSATLRRDLIGRVVRHLATDGYLRQHDYETQKPGWMATATAIARYAPDYQWQTLLAEVMAEPA